MPKRSDASTHSLGISNSPGGSLKVTIDQNLLASFRAGDCVAFVGAGFSAPVDMPLWRPLLERFVADIAGSVSRDEDAKNLLAYASKCVQEGQLARAASAIRRADPTGLIEQQLKSYFDADRQFRRRP